ncbi:MAG: hypothetical protein FWF18_04290 [Dehalococcoidia bacterium]|nr:hypothetical protein [Dehalococcoidia bacterium]
MVFKNWTSLTNFDDGLWTSKSWHGCSGIFLETIQSISTTGNARTASIPGITVEGYGSDVPLTSVDYHWRR